MRRYKFIALLLALVVAAASAGCSRLPRFIVLSDPLSPSEHVALGVAYERKGEFDLAVREYEAAIKLEPDNFQARVNLGNVFLSRKEFGKARAEYRRALEIRPDDPEATNNSAWCAIYSVSGIDEARRAMERIVAADAKRRTPDLLDTLGMIRMSAGDREGAKGALAEAEGACLAPGGFSCPPALLSEIRAHRAEAQKAPSGKTGVE